MSHTELKRQPKETHPSQDPISPEDRNHSSQVTVAVSLPGQIVIGMLQNIS